MIGLTLIFLLGVALVVQGVAVRATGVRSYLLIATGVVAAAVPVVFTVASFAFQSDVTSASVIAIMLCGLVAMGLAFTLPLRWIGAAVFAVGVGLVTAPFWFAAWFLVI